MAFLHGMIYHVYCKAVAARIHSVCSLNFDSYTIKNGSSSSNLLICDLSCRSSIGHLLRYKCIKEYVRIFKVKILEHNIWRSMAINEIHYLSKGTKLELLVYDSFSLLMLILACLHGAMFIVRPWLLTFTQCAI